MVYVVLMLDGTCNYHHDLRRYNTIILLHLKFIDNADLGEVYYLRGRPQGGRALIIVIIWILPISNKVVAFLDFRCIVPIVM